VRGIAELTRYKIGGDLSRPLQFFLFTPLDDLHTQVISETISWPRSEPRTIVKSASVFACFKPLGGLCSCFKKQNSCAKNRSTPLNRLSEAIPCEVLAYLCLREPESFLTPHIAPASRAMNASSSLSLSGRVKCIRLMLCLSFNEWRCIYPGEQKILAPFLEKSSPDRAPGRFADYLFVPKHPKADVLLTTVLGQLRRRSYGRKSLDRLISQKPCKKRSHMVTVGALGRWRARGCPTTPGMPPLLPVSWAVVLRNFTERAKRNEQPRAVAGGYEGTTEQMTCPHRHARPPRRPRTTQHSPTPTPVAAAARCRSASSANLCPTLRRLAWPPPPPPPLLPTARAPAAAPRSSLPRRAPPPPPPEPLPRGRRLRRRCWHWPPPPPDAHSSSPSAPPWEQRGGGVPPPAAAAPAAVARGWR